MMESQGKITTEQGSGALTIFPQSGSISISADALLLLGFLSWLVWDRLLKQHVVDKLDGVFAPIEEERRLNNILSQIGIITHASRVVLAAYHNGSIDSKLGYHLTKLSTINQYIAPGHNAMAKPIKDLPVGRIMYELEALMKAGSDWVMVEYDPKLPQACTDHLLQNNIHQMYNKHIKVGNLPIGILSLQYSKDERRRFPIKEEPYLSLLEELYNEISSIMRRRIIHPSLIQKIWMRVKSIISSRPTP